MRTWWSLGILIVLLSIPGVVLGGWIWLPATYGGALLGLGLCFLAIKLLEWLSRLPDRFRPPVNPLGPFLSS